MEKPKEIYSDKLLVKQLIEGNEKAFRELYDTYGNQIYAYSLSLLKSEVHAEEIVLEVFLRVWIEREKLDVSLSFKSYLFTMARNSTFNFLKRAANDPKLREEVFYRSQKSYDPKAGKIQEANIERIKQQAMALLPPICKQIFEMSRNELKTHADISQELNISLSTVKSEMSKAQETIRNLLSNRGGL